MTKHSPGPWYSGIGESAKNGRMAYVWNKENEAVAMIYYSPNGHTASKTEDQVIANANLIAKAPELEARNAQLLEVCKTIMDTIENATVINDAENVLIEEWMTGLHDKVANAIFENTQGVTK